MSVLQQSFYAIIQLTENNAKMKRECMLFMENTPTIILFWFFIIAIFMLMLISMTVAIMRLKKGKAQSAGKTRLVGKICLILSVICSIPICLVVGYVVYIYIG